MLHILKKVDKGNQGGGALKVDGKFLSVNILNFAKVECVFPNSIFIVHMSFQKLELSLREPQGGYGENKFQICFL